MIINSTFTNHRDDIDYYADHFPLPTEVDEWTIDLSNRTYYDEYIFNDTQILNLTDTENVSLSSLFSFSSPFSYILLILIVYSILTLILLTLSFYKQRRNEIENFYFGDVDDEIEQGKRSRLWKQLLIGKISKGDMEPLLVSESESDSRTCTFSLHIV